MQYDVIVVGAGLAGMVAALSAAEEGASVLLIDKGAIGLGSNSAISNAAFMSPTSSFSKEAYVDEVIRVGKGLNRSVIVKLAAEEAEGAIESLQTHGVEFNKFGNSFEVKSLRHDIIRGVSMVQSLASAVQNNERIRIQAGFYITDFSIRDDRIGGVEGFDNKGNTLSFYASVVVIAAGGAGGIYLRNDNHKSTMGQGYSLCAKAGLDLWDMEFVQFYPLVIAEPKLPGIMLYPSYPKEAKFTDVEGTNLGEKHGLLNLSDAIRKQRDFFSKVVFLEGRDKPVFMDYRTVPEKRWNDYPVSLLNRLHFDCKNHPIRVSPGCHFLMGGVRIDETCRTSAEGLFACGEIVSGLHGANRRGGNALTECAVFGRIAGRNAAAYSRENPNDAKPAETDSGSLWKPSSKTSALKRLRNIRQRVRGISWNHGGVLRDEAGIKEGIDQLAEVESELKETAPSDIIERKMELDLKSAALVLKAILSASLERKESRGGFQREDFPETDDGNWKKNTCMVYDPERNAFTISHHPAS